MNKYIRERKNNTMSESKEKVSVLKPLDEVVSDAESRKDIELDSTQIIFECGYSYQTIIKPTSDYPTKYDVGFLKGDRFSYHHTLGADEEYMRTKLLTSCQFIRLYRYDNFDDALEKAMYLSHYSRSFFFDANFNSCILYMDGSEWKTAMLSKVEFDGDEGQIDKSSLVWKKWF